MNNLLHVGLDVGSTTVKIAVMDNNLNTIYTSYQRHNSDTKNTVCAVLDDLANRYPDAEFTIALTGSGAMSAATFLNVPFIQEVVACKRAVEKYIPKTDVVIELGGEDAKIIYFGKSIEQRMNGTCAGGTGAFIDQMASLLNTDSSGLNELAKKHSIIYPIASRCGVFAKTDVQPLINEGAAREDIAASIFQAVVNQTISGLACGRPIRGNVAFLGGPLNYLSELRNRFIETLHLTDEQIIVPDEAHLLVAKGAALDSLETTPISAQKLMAKIQVLRSSHDSTTNPLKPLFVTNSEYEEFKARHSKDFVKKGDVSLVLLDIMMPEMDGITALRAIREKSNVPVILITAKSEDADKVLGLDVGADDYITKPFNPIEVLARVRSQLRRYNKLGGSEDSNKKEVLSCGGVTLDDRTKQVTMDGEEVSLTPTEYEILKFLMSHPKQVFSPRQIYSEVWKDTPIGSEGTVAVHIRHLREKLEIEPSDPRHFKVVWGQGYKFE